MANLGAVGLSGLVVGTADVAPALSAAPDGVASNLLCSVTLVGAQDDLVAWTGRDDSSGTPTPPCLWQQRPGQIDGIWCLVERGQVTVQVDVMFSPDSLPTPFLTIRRAAAVGLAADVTASAETGLGGGWIRLSAAFTATDRGAVEVVIGCLNSTLVSVRWDNLQVVYG